MASAYRRNLVRISKRADLCSSRAIEECYRESCMVIEFTGIHLHLLYSNPRSIIWKFLKSRKIRTTDTRRGQSLGHQVSTFFDYCEGYKCVLCLLHIAAHEHLISVRINLQMWQARKVGRMDIICPWQGLMPICKCSLLCTGRGTGTSDRQLQGK